MSTIFDGYRKLNDKQIVNQLAILETINFSNIFMYYRNKFKDSTVETIKKLLGTMSKDEKDDKDKIEDTEDKNQIKSNKSEQEKINELYEILLENRKELRKLSREELDIKLKLALCDRSGADIEDSEEEISLDVINESMKRLSLPKYLTPSQKIDMIYEKYDAKVFKYLKENPNTANQKKVLDFGDPKLLIAIFTETIKSWDIIQGSRIIDREVLLESVWLSAMSNVEPFTPKTEELPSASIERLDDDTYEDDSLFFDSINNFSKAKVDLETNDYKLSDLSKETDRYEKASLNKKAKHLELKATQKDIEKKIRAIEVDLEYLKNIYDQGQRDIKNNQLVQDHMDLTGKHKYNARKIENLNFEIAELDKVLRNLSLDKEYLLEEEKILKKRRDNTRKEYLIQEEKRYYELKKLWSSHFSDFEFEDPFLKEAVEYSIEDRIEIERILEEMKLMKDPRIISGNFKEEQINNTYNVEFNLDQKRVICLEYKIVESEDENDNKLEVKLLRILESIE